MRAVAAGACGVEVAQGIDLGPADEADVDAALLQQAHDVHQPEAGDGAHDVGRISHRVDEGFGGPVADDAVLEEPDRIRRVVCLGQPEAEQG